MYYYLALWRRDGIGQEIHDLLRMQVREAAGRNEDPSAVVVMAAGAHDKAIGTALLSRVAAANLTRRLTFTRTLPWRWS